MLFVLAGAMLLPQDGTGVSRSSATTSWLSSSQTASIPSGSSDASEAMSSSASSTGATMQNTITPERTTFPHSIYSRQTRSTAVTPSPAAASAIIAHSPSSNTTSSASPSEVQSTTSSISTRRAACTHIRLTRIYGQYKCHHCGRVPRLGWVYRCTQDFGEDLVGFYHRSEDSFTSALQRRLQQEDETRAQLPQIAENLESQPVSDQPRRSTESGNAQLVTLPRQPVPPETSDPVLKRWMYEAIKQGHYSEAQIRVLKSQRQLVLDRVAASAYPEPASQAELQDVLISDPITLLPGPSSSYYNRRYRRPNVNTSNRSRTATIAPYWQKPNPPRRTEEEIRRARPTGRHYNIFGAHGSYTPSDQQLQQTELQQPSVCVYQTCSFCRPVTRDRTWQCLDPSHLTTVENQQLPNFALDNRLLSNPILVQRACHRFLNPEPIRDIMTSSIFTSADTSDYYYDDDDDDFDLTTSGYDSSEISPDNSSEGTPTLPYYDERQGWDMGVRWMAPAPTPPSAPFRYGQPMPTPTVAFGNPLSGYGPSYPGQRRILRRASSMDPRMLRSAKEMAEMADIGLVGLGFATGNVSGQSRREPTTKATDAEKKPEPVMESNAELADKQRRGGNEVQHEIDAESSRSGSPYSRSGAVSALDLRPSMDEQLSATSPSFPASARDVGEPSEELRVGGGVAVTEEAVEMGEPDVVLSPEEQDQLEAEQQDECTEERALKEKEETREDNPSERREIPLFA